MLGAAHQQCRQLSKCIVEDDVINLLLFRGRENLMGDIAGE